MNRLFHVLVVEDNEDDAQLLTRRWLERVPGCQVTIASSYTATKQVFEGKHRAFDCICLDLQLVPDDLGGLRTLELLRAKADGVMVVVVSGTVTPEQALLFTTLGGIYICKKGAAWIDMEPLFRMLSL